MAIGIPARTALALTAIATGVIAVVVVRAAAAPSSLPPALAAPRFVEEATADGLVHAYTGEYPWVVGGGVAVLDCDEDGRPDLFLAGGSGPSALFRNVSEPEGSIRFSPGDDVATVVGSATGAYPLDIDSDGHEDLVVLRLGENVVLRGLGECRFERANEALALDGGDGWTVGFSATWEGASSLPTLAFGDYLGLDASHEPTDDCADGSLFRPAPDGTSYAEPLALRPSWCTLSMLFSDWDRSGRRDLRSSNDRHYYRDGEEQLWRMDPGAAPRLYSRADGWARLRIWGMGIASQDLTGDGYPEVYLTSQSDNKLQALADTAERPTFKDIALRLGATSHVPYAGGDTLPSTSWHPEFGDVNNDGYADLFVSKGNVGGETSHAAKDPSSLLVGQADGTFVEGAGDAGLTRFGLARGAALVDLNADGLLDIVQVLRNENVELWRNVGAGSAGAPSAMGRWVAVLPHEDGVNPDAIGAWIEVRSGDRVQLRERTVGGGHAGGQMGPIHVGIGSADRAQVRVTWPDGEAGPWIDVPGNAVSVVRRGASTAEPLRP